jgi:starvation-inducible outer membrane lipoprotein
MTTRLSVVYFKYWVTSYILHTFIKKANNLLLLFRLSQRTHYYSWTILRIVKMLPRLYDNWMPKLKTNCEFDSSNWQGVLDTTSGDTVCQ